MSHIFFTGGLEKGDEYSYCFIVRFLFFPLILVFFLVSCNSNRESIDNELYERESDESQGPEVYQDGDKEERYILVTPQGSGRAGWSGPGQSLEDILNETTVCQGCPPSSGYLLTKALFEKNDGKKLSLTNFCQGNLIDDNIFLVHSDCLPETVNYEGDSCESEVQVVLPHLDDDRPMEILECNELIALSSTRIHLPDQINSNIQMDWAALMLQNSSPGRSSSRDNTSF